MKVDFPEKTQKTIFAVVGAVSILLGLICFCMSAGSFESYEYYGGDAYTGIQNAAATTARNVQCLCKIARFGFGSILVVAGFVMFALSLQEKDSAPAAAPEEIAVPDAPVVPTEPVSDAETEGEAKIPAADESVSEEV